LQSYSTKTSKIFSNTGNSKQHFLDQLWSRKFQE